MTAPPWYHRVLAEGQRGDDVRILQRKLGLAITGVMDTPTLARVRGLQRVHGLPETGVVDDALARCLGPKGTEGQVPDWYDRGELPDGWDDDDVIRRFQASVGIRPTGIVDEETAVAYGDRTYSP